ncbi:hypothetical protein DPMN_086974 [Dreissena polymorpha]|uniref:Uncharacterized protein n=1 Tax=Dreissena polymorpha TaxID=45954 RepID=A0A9D4KS58_DREPO|nr:hypothetical protein DPMN_086974 [Dreissena polymorpha]
MRYRSRRVSPRCMFDPGRAPGLVMGPCIVEIDRIVIRDFQGSSACSTDGQTDGGDNHNIPKLFEKLRDFDDVYAIIRYNASYHQRRQSRDLQDGDIHTCSSLNSSVIEIREYK